MYTVIICHDACILLPNDIAKANKNCVCVDIHINIDELKMAKDKWSTPDGRVIIVLSFKYFYMFENLVRKKWINKTR